MYFVKLFFAAKRYLLPLLKKKNYYVNIIGIKLEWINLVSMTDFTTTKKEWSRSEGSLLMRGLFICLLAFMVLQDLALCQNEALRRRRIRKKVIKTPIVENVRCPKNRVLLLREKKLEKNQGFTIWKEKMMQSKCSKECLITCSWDQTTKQRIPNLPIF